jgi:hypothetical protein
MNEDRFAGLFTNQRREDGQLSGQESLRGFTTNPLGDSVTAAQALIYQAAYQRAQQEHQEPEWPDAEWWN